MATDAGFEFTVVETWILTGPRHIVIGDLVSGVVHDGDRFEVVGPDGPTTGTVRGLVIHIDRSSNPRREGLLVDASVFASLSPGTILRGVD